MKRTAFVLVVLLASVSLLYPSAQAEELSAAEAAGHVGERQTVCGVVVSAKYAVDSIGQPTFLNLDRPYPNHIFTVLIWDSYGHRFSRPPERFYRNEEICVSGVITTYDGIAQIEVRDPSQIDLKPSSHLTRLTRSPWYVLIGVALVLFAFSRRRA